MKSLKEVKYRFISVDLKSIITDIKSSDIIATADLSKISAFASYVDIQVKVVKDGREIDNIEVTPRTTAVEVGYRKSSNKGI